MILQRVLFAAFLFLACDGRLHGQSPPVDEKAKLAADLLEGMRSSRLSVTSGALIYDVAVYLESDGERWTRKGQLQIKWSGDDLWTHYQFTEGSGQQFDEFLIRNDEHLYLNRSEGDATRDLPYSKEGGVFGFDPRLLGVVSTLAPNPTVRSNLYATERAAPELIERDVDIDGTLTQHVRWAFRPSQKASGPAMHYYISNDTGFPVLKTVGWYPNNYWKCSYGENLPLPDRADSYRVGPDGEETLRASFVVAECELYAPIDRQTFTLPNLGLSIGEELHDSNLLSRLGYWDGEKLVESQSEAYSFAAANGAFNAPQKSRWLFITGATLVLVSIAVWFLFRPAKNG